MVAAAEAVAVQVLAVTAEKCALRCRSTNSWSWLRHGWICRRRRPAIPAKRRGDAGKASEEVDELEEELLGGARPKDPDDRYRLVKAELAELKLEQERGNLVEREKVLEMLTQRSQDLRRALMELPRAIANRLVGKTERQIQNAIRDSLEGILAAFVRKQGLHELLGDE